MMATGGYFMIVGRLRDHDGPSGLVLGPEMSRLARTVFLQRTGATGQSRRRVITYFRQIAPLGVFHKWG